ncbi:MAG: DNA gyrase subunit B, partial [Gammaproteobacteria bacterium]|nr:DNA gyrase subunit B [Gammaproteobacteria bacterium]
KILNVEKARFDKMLASEEIGNLITALGCGIGREEYNPDKIRYHRIVIMTDADIDGSHIRTLILTFFYRQMPELIENGYIYIAQPPLYKVKKNNTERYLKDDHALSNFLVQLALEKTQLFTSASASPISDSILESLILDYSTSLQIIERLARRYPKVILNAMLKLPQLHNNQLHDKEEVKKWSELLKTELELSKKEGSTIKVDTKEITDKNIFVPAVTMTVHGNTIEHVLPSSFFSSGEYQHLATLSEKIKDLIVPGSYIVHADHKETITSFEAMFDWLMANAKKGLGLQRYKGLGEMNPDQLWDTTMNPETRSMLRVTIEDGVAADQIFTTLMGDHVEPRREFIEQRALEVVNLDV